MMRNLGLILILTVLEPTVAASAQLDTAWVRYFDGARHGLDWPTSIGTDSDGNVYVAGGSTGSNGYYDLLVLKFDPAGKLEWAYSYDGPDSHPDVATALAVQSIGSIWVTGRSYSLASSTDIITIRLEEDGTTTWVRRYDNESHFVDASSAIAVDVTGNTAVVGWSSLTLNDAHQLTLLYRPDGSLAWEVRETDYPGGQANDVGFDPQGNILVAGYQFVPGSWADFSLTKFTLQGIRLWMALVDGQYSEGDIARDMAIGDDGTTYLAGTTGFQSTTLANCFVAAVSTAGGEVWEKQFDGLETNHSEAEAICVDASGSSYVAGWSRPGFSGEQSLLLKYHPDGALAWSSDIAVPGHGLQHHSDILVDRYGYIYVTGFAIAADADSAGCVTYKLDSAGNIVWTGYYKIQREPYGLDEFRQHIAMDSNGNVFVTLSDGYDIIVIKYEQHFLAIDVLPGSCPNIINTGEIDLNYHGIRPGAAAANRPTVPVAILGTKSFDVSRVDPSTIEIAGLSPLSHRLLDVSRPLEVSESECECTSAGADGYTDLVLYFDQLQFVAALGPVNDGEVRTLELTGKTKTGVPLSGSDCVTINEGPIRISPLASADEKSETGFAAYPNPFNAATVISFTLTTDSEVRLDVYDVLGRRVATLADELFPAGEHHVSWDAAGWASGVYFARLSTWAGTMTRKMVLVR